MAGPHNIALFPNSGMGHLMPYLRLASELLRHGCSVTLITARPVVSAAESAHIASFLHSHPQVNAVDLELISSDHNSSPAGPQDDPFFLQWDRICRSTHLLRPLLSSVTRPLSAIFADMIVAEEISPVATHLSIPLYLFSTTSTSFLSLLAHLPKLASESSTISNNRLCSEVVTVPGIQTPLPVKSIPPPLFEPKKYLFTSLLMKSSQALSKSRGILMNTFQQLEPSTLAALNHVQQSLPPIIPIGPLRPSNVDIRSSMEEKEPLQEWLGRQETKSVVLVSFGSRTAMSPEQIRELGDGLVRSGCSFIWVVKTSKVDRDDDVSDNDVIKGLLGETLWEKIKGKEDKGKVVRGWVEQTEILASPAIGGFVSHGGWNSVMEAAWFGVPMLVWPLHGDQRVNAKVVEDAGLGLWMQGWGMGNSEVLVKGDEIGEEIMKMMKDERLREKADKVKQQAAEAVSVGGSSDNALTSVLQSISATSSI